ncbi:MAG: hypothetical protein M3292_12705 [Actinomycetota bacterium]|nr:hypothetical protein [Actinomycetota bacterium]
MADIEQARWWSIRPASNGKPASYRCPFCGQRLHAMSDHLLIVPEGDATRRRHAHTECVVTARREGQFPLREEWNAERDPPTSLLRRLLRRSAR